MLRGLVNSVMHIGVVAQLGERLNGIQEVRSSILLSSTKNKKGKNVNNRSSLFSTWIDGVRSTFINLLRLY